MNTPANSTYRTLSLREYRLSHPQTADTPTLTQSSAISVLLERRRLRMARAMRRQELRRQLLALPGTVMTNLSKWVSSHMPQKVSKPAMSAQRSTFAKFDQHARLGA